MTARYTHASDGETDARTTMTTSEQLPHITPISTHISWSASMKFSAIMKSALIVAMLFLVGSEAFAQLPVRTRQLQILGSTGNNPITMQATGTVVPYTIEWPLGDGSNPVPSSPAWVANDTGYVKVRMSAIGTMELEWERGAVIDGDGDNGGSGNEVAFFTDNNTIVSHPTFTRRVGGITVGDTTTTAGEVTIISSATGNTNMINLGTDSDTDVDWNFPEIGPATAYNVVGTTNLTTSPTILTGAIPTLQSDGTVAWENNPSRFGRHGRYEVQVADVAANAFQITIAFGVDYATLDANFDADEIVITTNLNSPNGTIMQVTSNTTTGFTVQTTAPLAAGDWIMWMSNGTPLP